MSQNPGPRDEPVGYATEAPITLPGKPDGTRASASEVPDGVPTEPSAANDRSTAAEPSGLTTEQIAAARPADQAADASPQSDATDSEPVTATESPTSSHATTECPTSGQKEASAQLLDERDIETLIGRWEQIQVGFVDRPREAVEDADALVADLMQRLAQMFAAERSRLESQWSRGDQVSTEDLRIGLQRYRSFFQRLLSV
jgi:hypothetical protein